ncbi:MAG TPA: hypothetical protein VM598_01355, partial [Bdellovibrionota bacterium]|nr:hypothetical protein [Bdellovibrionota bacterium]
AFGIALPAQAGPRQFENEVRQLKASLDRGTADPEAAVRGFIERLSASSVRVSDLEGYLKSRLSAREYAAFRTKLLIETRGIEAGSLSPDELAALVGSTLDASSSDGLSWTACRVRTTLVGTGVLVASALMLMIADHHDRISGRMIDEFEREEAAVHADYSERIARATTAAEVSDLRLAEEGRVAALREALIARSEGHDNIVGVTSIGFVLGSLIGIGVIVNARDCDHP